MSSCSYIFLKLWTFILIMTFYLTQLIHQTSSHLSFHFLISWIWSDKFANCVQIWPIPMPLSLTREASNCMEISIALDYDTTFCYINCVYNLLCGDNLAINDSLFCALGIWKRTQCIKFLNLYSKSHTISFGDWFIYFISLIHFYSELGFLNSSIIKL